MLDNFLTDKERTGGKRIVVLQKDFVNEILWVKRIQKWTVIARQSPHIWRIDFRQQNCWEWNRRSKKGYWKRTVIAWAISSQREDLRQQRRGSTEGCREYDSRIKKGAEKWTMNAGQFPLKWRGNLKQLSSASTDGYWECHKLDTIRVKRSYNDNGNKKHLLL